MNWLKETDLTGIYRAPGPASTRKVADRLTPDYARFIAAARFCVLATVGPEGTDASPRVDDGPVARALDERHLAIPDWRGNDRIDSIRNIVRDGRVSLMFLVRGSDNAIRVNGTARLTDDAELRESFAHQGKLPRTVIVVQVAEIYFQCARAVIRSGLWESGDDSDGLPTPGQILANMTEGGVGGVSYDAEWPQRAARTMW
ncbi:pyridoxamine 5'-phosphate oxidase family protein [Paracoccus methylarcula]|uniref:Pyridoxamine 5'-phosphate oxidase family protein n=1 Tax=Paracoccus methylarcula TaxID=72022 RepID=A0A422R274_9RHOB|nr:pyridoxamine 5'-phosphate oxidase family protein [Paracoccus methylarcula]RNF36193.1 pyridoxamine 5'-phosphate oxidase family protein [Paracoccus methylarcula]